jgi:hypothetical protein
VLEQLRDRIDPDDPTHERCERERQGAGSGADVEGTLVAARNDELAHLLREPRSAAILPRGESLRRARETVSRRRLDARGPGRS